MYFDIDCNEIEKITKEDLLADFIESSESFLEENGIIYPRERISVCSAHKQDKHSYHIIYPDISIPDVITMKFIGEKIKSKMEYGQYLDCSYQKNKSFRLPFNHKFGKNTPIIFNETWSFEDEIINFKFKDDINKIVRIFEETIVNCFVNTKFIFPSMDFKKEKSSPINEINQEKLDEIYALTETNLIPKGLEIRENNNFIYLKNIDGFDCPICKRHHQKENAYLSVTKKGIYFKCFRNTELGQLLKSFYSPPPITYIQTFKEVIQNKFNDIYPKKCSKYSDVYMFNQESRLWKILENDKLCSKIANIIQDYSDENIKILESEKNNILNEINLLKNQSIELEQSRKELIGKGRPKASKQSQVDEMKENIEKNNEMIDDLNSKIKQLESKIKIWNNYQKESSRSEYHYKIIQEIISKNYDKNILKRFDKVEYLIPIKNTKVVDFKNQKVIDREKEHYFTFESEIVYNPDVPKYAEEVVSKIMCKDELMIKFLKKCLVYGCLGTNDQKKIFVFYGPRGNNGKTIIFSLIKILLGQLFGDINQTLFKEKESRANKPELLYLEKKRFAQITELKKEDKMDITFLKTISGRDIINIRDNYSTSDDVRDVLFDFVIYMMTNSFPNVVPDEALWKRFIFFPFDAKFTSKSEELDEENHIYQEDNQLLNKFENNDDYKSSILNMLLDGAKIYFEEGFNNIPEKCKDKTDGMKLERAEDQDPITLFLSEGFVIKDNSKKIERSKFNQCVMKYCKIKFNKGFKPGDVNESMRQKGYSEAKIKGIFCFTKIDIELDIFNKWIEENVNNF
jgi:phage/plasmid-associated DNA primase